MRQLPISIGFLVVLGCHAAVETDGTAERLDESPRYCDSSSGDALLQRADSAASRLVLAINARDAAAVAELAAAAGERPDRAAAAGAIEGYRHHLAGQAIAECRLIEVFPAPDTHIHYRVETGEGATKSFAVYHDQRGDHLRVYDELLTYFARAQRYSAAVVEAIRRQDARELARLLSVDDLDYPLHLAEQAIRNYEREFDLPQIRLHYDGLERTPRMGDVDADLNRWFNYRITGTRGGRAVEHRIMLSHGDGLLGWRDTLVPPYHGE